MTDTRAAPLTPQRFIRRHVFTSFDFAAAAWAYHRGLTSDGWAVPFWLLVGGSATASALNEWVTNHVDYLTSRR